MNWKAILKGGLGLAAAVFPPAAAAIPLVNAALDDVDRLDPATATTDDVLAAIEKVPPERRAELELQLEQTLARESVDKLAAMLGAETATANTRPAIADRMAWVIALGVGGIVVAILIATLKGDTEALDSIGASWELMAAALGIPAAVVRAYFGDRSRDKRARYAAAQGQDIGGAVGGVVQTIMQAVRQ